MYLLQQLSETDRACFRELRQLALRVNPQDFMMTSEEERAIPRLAIEEALEQPEPSNFFLGAFAGDPTTLVGIAGLVTSRLHKTRHAGQITSVFVHPEHRRKGVARMMLESILRQAAGAGLRSIRLEVVAENRSAIALYKELGFLVYGREPAAYRMDEQEWDLLLMTRDLVSAAGLTYDSGVLSFLEER